MEWNDETIGRLRMLWSDGHSTAEIGRRLGVSKNAIVGKAHRLELPARPSPIRRDGSLGLPSRPAIRRVAGPTLPPLPSAERPAAAAHRRSDAVRAEPSRPEPARTELAQSELAQSELVRSELSRSDLGQAELARSEPALLRPIAAVAVPGQGRAAPPRPFGRTVACCWPIGEPGTHGFHFCDANSVPAKPYCAAHAQLAYVKVRDRRDDAA